VHAVVVSLTNMRARFRMTANVVEVVQPRALLPHVLVARAVWEPRPDSTTSAEVWLTAGTRTTPCSPPSPPLQSRSGEADTPT